MEAWLTYELQASAGTSPGRDTNHVATLRRRVLTHRTECMIFVFLAAGLGVVLVLLGNRGWNLEHTPAVAQWPHLRNTTPTRIVVTSLAARTQDVGHARGRCDDARLSASGNVGFCGLSFCIVGLSSFHQILRSLCQEMLCRRDFVFDLLQPAQRRSGLLPSVRRIWLGAGPGK